MATLGHLLKVLLVTAFLSGLSAEQADESFDILAHISTSTPYKEALRIEGRGIPENLPEAPSQLCKPVQLNLLARHGARDPTRKRAKQLHKVVNNLKAAAENLRLSDGQSRKSLLETTCEQSSELCGGAQVGWIEKYAPSWEGRDPCGYLVPSGEEEMYELAQRWKARLPDVLDRNYHPDRYRIFGTQVPRASASAVAFGIGFLEGNGTLGQAGHKAFAVISDTKDIDRRLRFHKTCPAYKAHKEARKPEVRSYQEPVYAAVGSGILQRTGLNLTIKDVAGLWLLCKVDAALEKRTDQTCSLFTKDEVLQLEWADDVELHILKGYGAPINFRMAQALLEDILTSMRGAVSDRKEGAKKVAELGRLRFAHAETIMPLLCTLGLFQEKEQDVHLSSREVSLPPPLPPPHNRTWRGNVVAPFGANTALVLYDCGGSEAQPNETEQGESEQESDWSERFKLFVARFWTLLRWGQLRVVPKDYESLDDEGRFLVLTLHNERPIALPACNGSLFCPFTRFERDVLGPHLKGSFDKTCETTGWKYVFRAWLADALRWLGMEEWPSVESFGRTY